jgi:MtrB/PioB family decaheme-associated outer membrane protein
MGHKLTFRAMLLGGVCLAPLGAMADDLGAAPAAPAAAAQMTSENEIDLGLMGIGGTNTGQYGRYNGFTEQGADGLFGFRSVTRDAWDSGGTRYYIFTGSDINFQFGDVLGVGGDPNAPGGAIHNFTDSRYSNQTANDLGPNASAAFKIGDQGKWGGIGYYDAISYTGNIIDSIYTINGNIGTLNGGLPPWGGAALGGPAGVTSYTPAQIAAAERSYQVGTRRDIVGLTGTFTWNDWTITAAIRHEHKEGTLEESFDGAYGGTAFTLPIDYDTERYDVSASYNTPQLQAQLAYFLSNFTDNNSGVLLPDPLSGKAAPYQMTALYSTPPSNYAQYVTAMVGYNLTPGTRINVNARYGLETQNDTYPANTGDPSFGGFPGGFTGLNALGQGTSATSPNIIAQVYQGNVGISTNPVSGLHASAKYSIDGRNVSIDQVGGVYGAGEGMDGAEAANYAYVVPQEWLKQKVNLNADYLILPQSGTKLVVGYQFDDVDRSNAQVGHSDTNTVTVGLHSMMGAAFQGQVNYQFADRTGVLNYWVPWQNLTTGNSAYANGDTPSGAYYQAPMVSNAVNLRGDYSPGGPFSGGLQFKFENDDFHYPSSTAGTPAGTAPANLQNQIYGIMQDYNLTAGIDGNYRPAEGVNLHAYYTFEEIFYNNLGNGACSGSNTGACAGSVGYFYNKQTSDVQTVGLSAEWQATDRLKLTGEYTFAYGSVMFGEYNGVFVTAPDQNYQNVINYPDDQTIMNALTVKGSYKLTENVELSLGGVYSMFYDKDWRDETCAVVSITGGCDAGKTISILTPGYASPNYNVGAVMAMLKIKW